MLLSVNFNDLAYDDGFFNVLFNAPLSFFVHFAFDFHIIVI